MPGIGEILCDNGILHLLSVHPGVRMLEIPWGGNQLYKAGNSRGTYVLIEAKFHRVCYRYCKGLGSIPAGGPIVDEFFSTEHGY